MNEVRTVMHTNLITVDPSETVQTAAERMTEHHLGALIVVEEGKVTGMFTERDLLDRVVSAGRTPAQTKVGEVATKNPITVRGDTEILDCYRIIREHNFRHLPVTDEAGKPQGILSSRDFFECLAVRADPDVDLNETCARLGKLSGLMTHLDGLR